MNMPEDIKQIQDKLKLIEKELLEFKSAYSPRTNPQLLPELIEAVGLRYTTTQPTFTPNKEVEGWIYYDGSVYWLYVWSNNGWRTTQLDGWGLPAGGTTAQYIRGDGSLATFPTTETLRSTFTYQEQPSVGDLVTSIEAMTDQNMVYQNAYVTPAELLGDSASNKGYAMRFICPESYSAWKLTVYLAKIGTPASSIEYAIYSDSSGVPGSALSGGSTTLSAAGATGSITAYTLNGTGSLTRGTAYWVVLKTANNSATDHWSFSGGVTFRWSFAASDHALFDGTNWTASTGNSFRWLLQVTTTAGVRKLLDQPNDLGLQGGVQGIVESVDTGAGTCVVVQAGIYTTSGLTPGQYYYASSSTAGAITTTEGHVRIGYAISATKLYIFHKKQFTFASGQVISTASGDTPVSAFDFMLGFRGTYAEATFGSGTNNNPGYMGNTKTGGFKFQAGAATPISRIEGFWDCKEVGGSTGALGFGYSSANVTSYTKGSSTSDMGGLLTVYG